ncbi:MAG: beta-lactamase family protein [Oscillochloris sp.]|nr:beta-lactamase family protein [Oscillochloris sp.]
MDNNLRITRRGFGRQFRGGGVFALILALLLGCLPVAAPVRAEASAGLPTATQAALAALLAERAAAINAPGAVLAVERTGYAPWVGVYGQADLAGNLPMEPLSRLRIASLTKPYVAVVTLQLVQEGWLLLDHSVEHWLPGLVPGGERIQVRHLLSHTSGLPEYMTGGFVGKVRREPERVYTPPELVAEALRYPRRFAPGAAGRWSYSNTNYILLGLIIEAVTRNSLEHELQQRILTPLGLRNTAMAPARATGEGLARGYVRQNDYTELNMSFAWAAGGLTSTADDTLRFANALFAGRLLRPEYLALMRSYVAADRDGYGLGLMRSAFPGLGNGEGHTGGLAGYRSVVWHLPEHGSTIVVLVNRYESDPQKIAVPVAQLLSRLP